MRSIHCLGEKMSDFGKKILNRLLDKYENSVISKKGSNRNLKIALTLKDKELNTYICNDSYNYRDENDAVLAQYQLKGFIFVEKDEYGDFKSLFLNTEKVGDIYNFLKRDNPAEELFKIRQLLDEEQSTGVIKEFVSYCNNWISEKFSFPKTYFDSCEQLRDILLAIKEIQKLEKETKFRDFSVKVYGDSKKFEKLKKKIAKIFYEFDEECLTDNFDEETVLDILSEKNLVKNTTYAIIKGDVTFELNNVVVNLRQLGHEFCLSDEMINGLRFVKTGVQKVITVENLTSFYDFNDDGYIVLYLGGFHNHTKRMLLKKLQDNYPELLFFHFGDIDTGGIHILKHLRAKTNIQFLPYKMDVETLSTNMGCWKKLTDNDIKRLRKIEDKEFQGLIDYMLSNNCKLEQEAIDWK